MVARRLIPLGEIECSYARSSGPGGQNVNKVNSKCVLRWPVVTSPSLPADLRARFVAAFASRLTLDGVLIVMSDRFRDQKRNFEDCLAKAQAMLDSVCEAPKKRHKTRPTRGSQRRRVDQKKAHSQKKALRRGVSD